MLVALDAVNAMLPSPLCVDPMFPLAAAMAIFKATLDSPSVEPKDKGEVTEAGNYVTEWQATVSALVDNTMPTVLVLCKTISNSK